MKTKDDRLFFGNRGFFSKTVARRGIRSPQLSDPRSMVEIRSEREHVDARQALTGGLGGGGVEALTRGAYESPVCRGRGARWPLDRRSTTLVPRTARTVIRESGPSDQNWTVRMGTRGLHVRPKKCIRKNNNKIKS
jgi:hypothetical protein